MALDALLLAVCSVLGLATLAGPENLTFEGDTPGRPPAGWFVPGPCAAAGWTATVRSGIAKRDGKCVVLAKGSTQGKAPAGAAGNLMQQIDAKPYQGKRVVMSAWMRAKPDNPQAGGAGQMWFRVDREGGKPGFFDNCSDRQATSSEWKEYRIIADVDPDAVGIAIGFMAMGATIWVDDVSFSVVGDALRASEPLRPVSERGLANLTAFARLIGWVRYYYPGDEAAACDWEELVRTRVPAVEAAADAAALAAELGSLLAAVAPAARVNVQPFGEDFDPRSMLADGDQPNEATAWLRLGFSAKPGHGVYEARRLTWGLTQVGPDNVAVLGDHKTAELAPGMWTRVPLALYRDGSGTLPRALVSIVPTPDEKVVPPSGDDRTTRLADVILAWNVFQHHYPYFDVVKVDWTLALSDALKAAATDADGAAFCRTLQRMVARLQDGHGYVGYSKDGRWSRVPLAWAFVGDRLVVTETGAEAGEIRQGDEVLELNGRVLADASAEAAERVSAATPQFRRFRTAADLGRGDAGATCSLKLRRPDGTAYAQSLAYGQESPAEPRPQPIAEVRPGIWYVDIDRVTDDDVNAAMSQLAGAGGLVFDLRGYPSRLSTVVLAHLTDKALRSAHWCIPILPRPDREGVTFTDGGWPVMPAEPRWTANAAFIIDGRAISYAETYMGIVEHFKLAAIVGETTAGTNGNVTSFTLPGGYSIGFTGMRVLKHDGSTHHGIGIRPTIPVERTIEGIAAGRDELLEAAIAHVEQHKRAK